MDNITHIYCLRYAPSVNLYRILSYTDYFFLNIVDD